MVGPLAGVGLDVVKLVWGWGPLGSETEPGGGGGGGGSTTLAMPESFKLASSETTLLLSPGCGGL